VILERHHIYVYPRVSKNEVETQFHNHEHIHFIDAPLMQISSTFIRKAIAAGKNVKPMFPQHVWHYLDEMNFYK
jgi:nicotinate-nucleotide adenylyltransferase